MNVIPEKLTHLEDRYDKETLACLHLWASVALKAYHDAMGKNGIEEVMQRRALSWIFSEREDYITDFNIIMKYLNICPKKAKEKIFLDINNNTCLQ